MYNFRYYYKYKDFLCTYIILIYKIVYFYNHLLDFCIFFLFFGIIINNNNQTEIECKNHKKSLCFTFSIINTKPKTHKKRD